MKFTILVYLLMSSNVFAQLYDGGQPEEWKDITGKKYSGSDKDLSDFKITPPEINCDYIYRVCSIKWNNVTERASPDNREGNYQREQLTEYEIFFQVLDRKGNEILKKSYKWDINVTDKKKDYIISRYDRIARWGDINLSYTTVNYWVQNIKWKAIPKEVQKDTSGPKAFTVKEQLEAIKAQKKK